MNRRAPKGRARFPSVFGHRGPYSTGPQPFPAPSPRRFRVCFATALFVLPNSVSSIMDHSPRKIKHFFGGHIFHFREIGNVFRRFFLFFQKSPLLSVRAFVLLVLYDNFFVMFICYFVQFVVFCPPLAYLGVRGISIPIYAVLSPLFSFLVLAISGFL